MSGQAGPRSSSRPSEGLGASGGALRSIPAVDDPPGATTSEQLAQVVHGADEVPLGGHLPLPSQAEPAEAHGLLDLLEDGFDDDLAPSIVGTALLRA